jgi:guanylate kinase
MGYADQYDAVVVNDDLERAAAEVLDLIQRRRSSR